MRALCLLIMTIVCIGSVTAQWGYGRPYYGPIGPFGGTPYARLRAMMGYGMMPYGGYGGYGGYPMYRGYGGYPMYRGYGWG
ncbi:unnamed protein product [Cylicocyclus nassatus]|uniref:Uncharacterized protein n=1 Tax=Cylicocyclus nassatus TaxID=53992 RepID=A0AA36MBD1_CYLNA|nr:unnamed protein product [Cylicocyclus nassatus]